MIDNYEKIVLLITPGLDSICAYFRFKDKYPERMGDLTLVHVPLSPRYAKQERDHMMSLMTHIDHPVEILDFRHTLIHELPNGFISSRNLLLAAIIDSSALVNYNYSTLIAMGFTADDRVYDSSEEYCDMVSKLLYEETDLGSFVRDMGKDELVKWFFNDYNGLQYQEKCDIIDKTFSCYSDGENECLQCNACFRKSVVLNAIGYETRDVSDDEFLEHRLGILNDADVSESRKKSITDYISAVEEKRGEPINYES